MPAPPEIELTDAADPAAREAVLDVLVAYNDRFAPHGDRPLRLLLRRPGETAIIGGLIGYTLFCWLHVELFAVPEALRGRGLGTALLRRAEAEAVARGCVGAYLDTFSFQARPFYERQGYTVFGTLEGQPPGQRRFYLHKRLA